MRQHKTKRYLVVMPNRAVDLALPELARIAQVASDAARVEIMKGYCSVTARQKPDGTIVTDADLAAERAVRSVLEKATPSFAVVGEEFGGEIEDRPTWIVDPIDGTISYARGIPLFGSLIALLEQGEPVLGLIDLPALGERIVGWKGGGVRCNGKPVRCSLESELSRAIIAHGDLYTFDLASARGGFERIARATAKLRGYTDAFGHAMTLCGRVDAMIDLDLNPWDSAASRALVPEAGGRCTVLPDANGKHGLVFGSPALVEQLLTLLETPRTKD